MIIDNLFENNKKPLNEVDPRNFDSDEDYYAALNAPAKRRSAPSDYPYSQEQDDDYFREIFRKKREAAKKAEQDGEQGVAEMDGNSGGRDGNNRKRISSYGNRDRDIPGPDAHLGSDSMMASKDMQDRALDKLTKMLSDPENMNVLKRLKTKEGVAEGSLNESVLLEDPVYRDFKRVGRYIAEQKLTEPEILQVFADAEAGMTDKATGANRTFLGKGKDATVDFAKDVAGAVNGVLDSIQNSVPIAAVDVAYDQATDALANLTGGQKGAVMDAIKKYRLMAKQYPKTAGLAKAALVAITGLATGGAGLPAAAGLVYGLDSAIKGDKLSSVLGKGGGAALLAWLGKSIHGGATQTGAADTNAFTNVNQMGDHTGEYVDMPDGSDTVTSPLVDPGPDLVTYTVKSGDTLSQIADDNGTTVQELIGLNPHLAAGTGAEPGQSMNPDVLFPGDQITLPPATGADVYTGNVGTNSGTMADIARGQVPNSAITQGMAARNAVRESVKYRAKLLSADQLIDQKATVLSWALSESVGRKSKSVNLTTQGIYTVFENVDRYRKAILEATQPGRPELPDQYRPDMPGGAGVQSKPGLLGRGLNYLDKKVKGVGGALSNFGHQFTTGVTKEKLKMNWHQAGKPSDSDQLAAWLVKQGVPQPVVTSVFGKMGIPYTAPAAADVAEPAAKTGGAQRQAYAGTNPATGKPWTVDELQARMAPATTAEPTTTTKATATAGGPGFNAGNVMKLPGMEKYAKKPAAAPIKTPNFAGPGGYSNVTTSFKTPGVVPATPKAPVAAKAPSAQLSKDEYIRRIGADALPESRIATALKKPVDKMLQMVETKEDVQRIKKFIDDTFVKHGAVTESAFAVRNKIIEHVTQVGAQRRREYARKGA